MNTQKTAKPSPAEWKRFESAIDAILKAKPVHRKAKPAKKKPRKS